MKTLTVYALMLGVSVTALWSSSEDRAPSYYAPLESMELSLPIDASTDLVLPETVHLLKDAKRKKEYHIYFENRTEDPLEVSIRFKAYDGSWDTKPLKRLNPGEQKFMGLSDEKTYFLYATNNRKQNNKTWSGPYQFEDNQKSVEKLRLKKKEIWECYDTTMCKSIAVFR